MCGWLRDRLKTTRRLGLELRLGYESIDKEPMVIFTTALLLIGTGGPLLEVVGSRTWYFEAVLGVLAAILSILETLRIRAKIGQRAREEATVTGPQSADGLYG